jgi:hypothetical protein
VSYGVNPLIISALWECLPPSRPPVRDKIGSEKDLWSEQISKIAKRFLRFARSSLVFGGEAAELQPEFTLNTDCELIPQTRYSGNTVAHTYWTFSCLPQIYSI